MLELIAYMAGVTGLLSLIGVALLLFVDDKVAERQRAEHIASLRASLKKANAEVSQHPHLRYPSPLPTITTGTST